MPQLNPTPWFLVMLTTWLAINVVLTLINNTEFTNKPTIITSTNNLTKQMHTWSWPW